MKSITGLILSTAIIFPTISYSQSTEDHWRVKTNVYLELEEYQGQRDSQNNKVYDKASMIGKLSLTNPTSTWSFDLEHRESLRNHGKNFSNSRDSYIRNRTQIGATKQFIKDKISNLDINFTYRKESNDGTPGTQSRSSNSLYWLMPSGSIYLDSRWTFDFWGAEEFSKLIYRAKKVYDAHRADLEKERTEDEFMAMYEQYEAFDELEEEYFEMEEQVTATVAGYLDDHLELFAKIIK